MSKYYTTAELHVLPDDTVLMDWEGVTWSPYVWNGKRTKGWITGNDGDRFRDYKSASQLAELKLTEVKA